MSTNKAAEFLNKVLSDEALKAQLADKSPAQAAELAAELGYEVTEEELIEAEKELRRQSRPEIVELDLEDMDKVAGGYFFHPQVCSSSFDDGDTCRFNDSVESIVQLHATSFTKSILGRGGG